MASSVLRRRLWIAAGVFAVVVIVAMTALCVGIFRGLERSTEAGTQARLQAEDEARQETGDFADEVRSAAATGTPDDAELNALAEPHGVNIFKIDRGSALVITVMTTRTFGGMMFGGSASAYVCAEVHVAGAGGPEAAVDVEWLDACPPPTT